MTVESKHKINVKRCSGMHDDVIKWKHLPRYWPYVRGIHRSTVNSPHKGQWHGVLMFSLICAWIIAWVNNRQAGDLRRHGAHYDVIVMCIRVINLVSFVHADIQADTDTRKTISTSLPPALDAIFSYKWLVWYAILRVDQISHKPSHQIENQRTLHSLNFTNPPGRWRWRDKTNVWVINWWHRRWYFSGNITWRSVTSYKILMHSGNTHFLIDATSYNVRVTSHELHDVLNYR